MSPKFSSQTLDRYVAKLLWTCGNCRHFEPPQSAKESLGWCETWRYDVTEKSTGCDNWEQPPEEPLYLPPTPLDLLQPLRRDTIPKMLAELDASNNHKWDQIGTTEAYDITGKNPQVLQSEPDRVVGSAELESATSTVSR